VIEQATPPVLSEFVYMIGNQCLIPYLIEQCCIVAQKKQKSPCRKYGLHPDYVRRCDTFKTKNVSGKVI